MGLNIYKTNKNNGNRIIENTPIRISEIFLDKIQYEIESFKPILTSY